MRMVQWGMIIGAALVCAACSSEPEAATTPTIELATTTITTLPSTTEPPTTEAPTTTEDPRIAEVEAAVAAFRETQILVLTSPSEPLDVLADVAVGVLLDNNITAIQKVRAEGQVFSGDFVERSISTELTSAESALHTACGIDRLSALSPDGERLEEPDEAALLRQYSLEFDATKGWLVALVAFAGNEATTCEL